VPLTRGSSAIAAESLVFQTEIKLVSTCTINIEHAWVTGVVIIDDSVHYGECNIVHVDMPWRITAADCVRPSEFNDAR